MMGVRLLLSLNIILVSLFIAANFRSQSYKYYVDIYYLCSKLCLPIVM